MSDWNSLEHSCNYLYMNNMGVGAHASYSAQCSTVPAPDNISYLYQDPPARECSVVSSMSVIALVLADSSGDSLRG